MTRPIACAVLVISLLLPPLWAGQGGDAKVTAALGKVLSAKSYAFRVVENKSAAVEAKYQEGQPLYAKADEIEFFKTGDLIVYRDGDKWMRSRRGTLSDPLRILGGVSKVNALRLPHEELAGLAKKVKNIVKIKDGIYRSELTAEGVQGFARSENKGVAQSGAMELTLNEQGEVVRYAIDIRLQGRIGNAEIDGTTRRTVALTAVGTTKVEPSEEARKRWSKSPMSAAISVFLDFNLPNATTWFYFSWLLAIALFFKFSRILSMRNWDVITLFLLVPGLLVIQASRPATAPIAQQSAVRMASVLGQGAGQGIASGTATLVGVGVYVQAAEPALSAARWLWWGYLWLLCGSAYFLFRCFLDLALIKRPSLAPNLSFGGLAWFGGALLVCLIAVAFRTPEAPPALPAQPVSPGVQSAAAPVGQESPTFQLVNQTLGARFWLLRAVAVLGHIAVVVGLAFIGWRHFQDLAAGMAAATFYLMLPYTGLYVGQAHHVWPMALIVWAIATYQIPILAGAFLGLAAGTMYFPVVVLPLWIGFYWKRGAYRFVSSLLLVGSLGLAVLWVQGELEGSVQAALQQSAWQPWKVPTTESFWTGVHWVYRIPIFLAYIALVVLTSIWPSPKNLAQVIALSAALLIGIQFWYADQGGVYVLWYLPLLLLLVFRPNLDDRRPMLIVAETDWLASAGRALGRVFSRLVKGPERMQAKH